MSKGTLVLSSGYSVIRVLKGRPQDIRISPEETGEDLVSPTRTDCLANLAEKAWSHSSNGPGAIPFGTTYLLLLVNPTLMSEPQKIDWGTSLDLFVSVATLNDFLFLLFTINWFIEAGWQNLTSWGTPE